MEDGGAKERNSKRSDVDAKGLEAVEFISSALKHEMSNRLFLTSMSNATGRLNETSRKRSRKNKNNWSSSLRNVNLARSNS